MVRESRHLWVGNLPETVREEQIQDYFSRYGRVEKVKLLAKTSPDGGRAAFVDFVDIRSATKANEAQNRMGERELRTNYNEPGAKNLVDFRGHAMHRIHGAYPPGIGSQPVVIYAAPPGDHLIHSQAYRPLYHREERRIVSAYTPLKRDKSPGRSSLSDGSPSDKRSREYSSDSDDTDDNSVRSTSVIIKNLPRNTDSALEEGIYHEFRKAGEIAKIKIKGTGADRYAIVKFTKPEEAERATHNTGKVFQGQTIRVLIRGNKKSRNRSPEKDDLAFDPHATRTVFVGNIEKTMMHGELRNIFERFGDVVDVDIKKMQTGLTTYAFVQYIDINGAMFAKRKMDREYIGHTIVKIGYGRGTPTNCLWIGNLPSNVVDHQLSKIFHPFGYVQHCLIDKRFWQALIRFETIEACTHAFAEMHGKHFQGKRLAVDYASPACRDGFYRRMEEDGQLDRRQLEPSPTPPDAHINFQNVARGGAFQPRGNNFIVKSYISSEPRAYAEYHPELSYDKGERDMYGRDKERPRVYSPMSHGSNSPKHLYSPKHTLSRESISPVSSLGFYDRKYRLEEKKRKHSHLGSPFQEEVVKKKEKRKKKEKKEKQVLKEIELGYPPVDINSPPLKLSKEAKREKKERKKKDKAKRKSEKKQKKILKLRSLQEKLSETIVAENPDDILSGAMKSEHDTVTSDQLPNKDVELMKLNEAKTENHVISATQVNSNYEQLDGNNIPAISKGENHPTEKDQNDCKTESYIENQVVEEIRKAVASPEEGELNEEDGKSSCNQFAGSPISQDDTNKILRHTISLQPVEKTLSSGQISNTIKVDTRRSTFNYDSTDSSDCTSSESDSSDTSSDDSENKKHLYKRHSCHRENRKNLEKSREPKAYRQSNRDDFERREHRAERDREREHHRSRYLSSDSGRRSPGKKMKSKSPNSNSPSSYLKRDNSYDRRHIRSPYSKSPNHSFERKDQYDLRARRTHTPPPPPPLTDKVKHSTSNVSNGQNAYQRGCSLPSNNSTASSQSADTLMDLLRRYPVMWQGLLGLKNDTAAVQMHFLSGNVRLAESSLPRAAQPNEVPPTLRISQRMKLETSQLEGVDKRIQLTKEHCMLLALPCGRDPLDVHAQTRALKTGFITYLQQKQAAGIINTVMQAKQTTFVIHIFPPCDFAQGHLARVAPDLLNSAADSGHLMVLISPM